MFAALLANWKTIAWGVVIATFLASIAAGVLEHKHLVADVTKTADAAGYARAVAEDKAALAAHLAHDAADKAAQVKKDQEIVDAYESQLAQSATVIAAQRLQFSHLRVCNGAAAGANHSGPVSDAGQPATGIDDTAGAAGGSMPSLDVAGAELSRCDAQATQLAALQQWVAAHFAKSQDSK
jgi:hypothetical protein